LYTACMACQNVVGPWPSWAIWSAYCNNDTSMYQYPISFPINVTAIPRWAFILGQNDTFDTTTAGNTGRDPETFGTLPAISSVSSILSSSTANPSSTLDPSSTSENHSSTISSNIPSIVGGAISGVVGLIMLSILIWLLFNSRSRGTLLYVTRRMLSHRASSRRSDYLSSLSVHSTEPEMEQRDALMAGTSDHPRAMSPESVTPSNGYPYSVTSSEPNMPDPSPLYRGGGGYNLPIGS